MLKNKKVIYLLIALVALIWGLIFYKIYSNFGGTKQVEKNSPLSVIKAETLQGDSIFTLSLDYPDPFLKGPGPSADTPILASVKNRINSQVVNWPLLEYRGLLNSNGKNESTGLLKVQSSNFLVKHGIVYSGIKIRTITKDSIQLEYQKVSRWLPILRK